MQLKGLKVNIEKTKVMRSGKSGGEIVKTERWPCAVCRKGCSKLHSMQRLLWIGSQEV